MKKLISLALCLALCLLGTVALAQEQNKEWEALLAKTLDSLEGVVSQSGRLTVSGTASVAVTPDEAHISVGVEYERPGVAEAQSLANETMDRLIQALKALGFADKDMGTSNYSINPSYDYSGSTPKLTGYRVSTLLSVTVRDFQKINAVIEAAVAAGANQIHSLSFSYSKHGEAYREALAKAIEIAKVKAEVMAQAAGKQIGALLELTEGSQGGYTPYYATANIMLDRAAAPAMPETQIMGGQSEVSATVNMVFAVK